MSLCACGAEMGTGGCTQPWRHPLTTTNTLPNVNAVLLPDYKGLVDSAKLILRSIDSDERKVSRLKLLLDFGGA